MFVLYVGGQRFKCYKIIQIVKQILTSMFLHQLTDITFLVGDTREPVCAVRAVLAARYFLEKLKLELKKI